MFTVCRRDEDVKRDVTLNNTWLLNLNTQTHYALKAVGQIKCSSAATKNQDEVQLLLSWKVRGQTHEQSHSEL